jgi:aminomethyltransferase
VSELQHGPLDDRHRELGASFAEFGGWLMPVSYAGTVSEHNATRNAVGLFDVSHLGKALVRARRGSSTPRSPTTWAASVRARRNTRCAAPNPAGSSTT